MRAGFSGTFVIAWDQADLDGLANAPLSALRIGASWQWSGDAVCVDGPRDILVLNNAIGVSELHHRAAQSVRRLVGSALAGAPVYRDPAARDGLFDGGFDVTDGIKRYAITLIDMDGLSAPLMMFLGEMPPARTDLWVVSTYVATAERAPVEAAKSVICFTPTTRITTPDGVKAVAELQEGDLIQTKDNGPQQLRWIGHRRVTGARLYAMPHLRPVRIRAGALGMGEPDEELVVSPNHRMILRGRAARDLFNADEVLAQACDLVNDGSIAVDFRLQEVTYVHLLFDAHQVIFANGLETESFHPASAELDAISPDQRARLLDHFPDIENEPYAYGGEARRNLSRAEAAIFLHARGASAA